MKQRQLTNYEISTLCLELSLLLHAGVSIGDSLAMAAEGEVSPACSKALKEMANQVDDGSPLSAAVKDSGLFPAYVHNLLDAGEQSGRTEEALSSLAHYYEDQARLDQHLRSALLSPAILLLVMLAVIVILLVKVLPIFDQVYADLGGQLTGVAGGLLAFGQVLDGLMPVLCILLGGAVLFLTFFSSSAAFRTKVLGMWQKVWGDKGVSRKIYNARFAQSLAMGMQSGLPLEEAASLAANMVSHIPAAHARCLKCLEMLQDGESLPKAMEKTGVLPQSQCRLLELGLRSGAGDQVMEEIARRLSEESETALTSRIQQIEPALVVITSFLVGLILFSVMLPLMNIMSAIG